MIRFHARTLPTLALLAAAATACDGGGGGGMDAGMMFDDSFGGGDSQPPGNGGRGEIVVSQSAMASTVTADLVATPGGVDPCTVRLTDNCRVIHCAPGAAITHQSIGHININGGMGMDFDLTPMADGTYAPVMQAAGRWMPMDMVQLEANDPMLGGSFAEVDFPGSATVTAPTVDASTGRVAVNRSAGLQLAWTNDTGEDLTIVIEQGGSAGSVNIRCGFPTFGDMGTGPMATVGPDVLADLAPTTSGMPATMVRIGSHNEDEEVFGDTTAVLSADAYALAAQADVQ